MEKTVPTIKIRHTISYSNADVAENYGTCTEKAVTDWLLKIKCDQEKETELYTKIYKQT